ncbi:hypothetical protein Hanom_Chr06g00559931 [Helianthus anomalus]
MLFVHYYLESTCLLYIHKFTFYFLSLSHNITRLILKYSVKTQRFTQNHTSESPIQRPNFIDQHTANIDNYRFVIFASHFLLLTSNLILIS